jgi:hypothetical protein
MTTQFRCTALMIAGIAGLFIADVASAQFSMGGSTSTGSFGSRTLGGSTSSNRTGRSTGASSSSNSLNGITGQNGQNGQNGQGGGLGATGSERYIRGNRNGSFVGADSGDGAANSYSGMAGGANGMGGMGGLGGMMGNQMMMQAMRQGAQNQNQGNKQQQKLTVRTPFRVDAMSQPVLTTTFTARMQTRYSNLPALQGKAKIEPVLEGDVLVLRGQVESAAARQLAEDLLSLEPGVGQVRNELVIAQPASTPVSVSVPAVEPSAPKRVSRPLER